MVVRDVLPDRASQVALARRDHRFRHSHLMDRTNRSACALQFGARTGVCTTWTTAEGMNSSTAPVLSHNEIARRTRKSRSSLRPPPQDSLAAVPELKKGQPAARGPFNVVALDRSGGPRSLPPFETSDLANQTPSAAYGRVEAQRMAILGPPGSICRAQHSATDAEPSKFRIWRRRPDLNRGSRFFRFR